jgi:hypothetical protein
VNPAATEFFRGSREAKGWRLVARELALAALLLLLLEIAARRLELWSLVRVPEGVRRSIAAVGARLARPRSLPTAPVTVARATPPPASGAPPPTVRTPAPPESMESALGKARRAANKRLDR